MMWKLTDDAVSMPVVNYDDVDALGYFYFITFTSAAVVTISCCCIDDNCCLFL